MDKALQAWPLCKSDSMSIFAGQLKHRIPSFGYVFQESPRPGKLNSAKLIQFGVPKGRKPSAK